MTRQTPSPRVIPPSLFEVYDDDGARFARKLTHDLRPAVLAEPEDYTRLGGCTVEVVSDIPQVLNVMPHRTDNMTSDRVKAIREGLGLTQPALAERLRLGPHGKRAVIRWETGHTPVPGPVSVALEALASGWEPGADPGTQGRAEEAIRELETAVLQAQEQVRNLRLARRPTRE
jgi:transcriptional regulator with XRE-family HTH domain